MMTTTTVFFSLVAAEMKKRYGICLDPYEETISLEQDIEQGLTVDEVCDNYQKRLHLLRID